MKVDAFCFKYQIFYLFTDKFLMPKTGALQ